MANLLLDYTVLDAAYTHGKFRFIQGDNTASPPSIDDPRDTRIDDIRAYPDTDPVLFSYLNGSDPRALLVNIATNFTAMPPTSTGKYTVCVPNTAVSPITWSLLSDGTLAKDITLVDGSGNPVAGNPHGVAAIGDYLYIVEYDTPKIYRLSITALEGTASGGTCPVTQAADATSLLPTTPTGLYHHGAALISLVYDSTAILYALFTSATIDSYGSPDVYASSTIVRYMVDASTGTLSNPVSASAGGNATALIPVTIARDRSILVPAIGGKQNYGNTNGTASNFTQVTNLFSAGLTATTRITGDASTDLSPTGNYDIIGAAVSDGGNNSYILLVTYNDAYQACWRLYSMKLPSILTYTGSDKSITGLINAGYLTSVESGYGVPGNLWEVLYDNTVTNGRLWFLKGSPIRVSAGNNYTTVLKNIDYSGSLYDSASNVNSADLIAEMLYQAAQGVTLNTQLGTTRQLAKTVQAAKAASEEEEDK